MRTNLILAVLAALLAIPTILTIQGEQIEFTDYEDVPRLFDGFTPDNIGIVQISSPRKLDDGSVERDAEGKVVRDSVQFQRQGADEWMIRQGKLAGVTVRGDLIYERVLRHLEQIRRDENALIAEGADAETLAEYGLDEANATLIQAASGSGVVMAVLLLGADASGGRTGQDVVRGFYVRRKDQSDVVLYEQPYWVVTPNPETWVDRNPVRFPVDQVIEVALENEFGKMLVYKDAPTDLDWKHREAPDQVGAVRSAEITSFVRNLSFLNVQRYVEPLPQADPGLTEFLSARGLQTPKTRASVKLANGAELAVELGDQVPGANEYYARVTGVEFLLTVGDWVVTAYERDPKEFFDPPESAVVKPPREASSNHDGSGDGAGKGGKGKERSK